MITYDDFEKLDVRMAKIVAAEKIEGADKLLKLTLDLGDKTQTVAAGIALHYQPEEVVGLTVPVLVNLAPRLMRGVMSCGMVLMPSSADGKPVPLLPMTDVPPGVQVK